MFTHRHLIIAGIVALSPIVMAVLPLPHFDSPNDADVPTPADSRAPIDSHELRGEGIGVQGRWTIIVRNADGSIAERRDFHNDLTPCGAAVLMAATATGSDRRFEVGKWLIRLGGGIHGEPFVITEDLNNLEVQTADGHPETILTGMESAPAGSFVEVQTAISNSDGFSSPCADEDIISSERVRYSIFTRRVIPVLSVEDGQSIDVTAALSFN